MKFFYGILVGALFIGLLFTGLKIYGEKNRQVRKTFDYGDFVITKDNQLGIILNCNDAILSEHKFQVRIYNKDLTGNFTKGQIILIKDADLTETDLADSLAKISTRN